MSLKYISIMKQLMLLFSMLVCASIQAQEKLSNFLQEKKLQIEKIKTPDEFSSAYKILIKQPLDHSDTTKGFFHQKFFLSHRSFDAPVLLFTSGYAAKKNVIFNWTKQLKTNQIFVEHRYFGESSPDSISWDNLKMENVANDLHNIRIIVDSIYTGKWISNGRSKGALTALCYKYFYPEDIDITIAQTPSIKTSKCDTSVFQYIDKLSKQNDCYDELKNFQKQVLTRKSSLIPLLKNKLISKNKTCKILGLETILENAVLEMPFALWQNGAGCSHVPNTKLTDAELFNMLSESIGDWFMTDQAISFNPWVYQAYSELGFYGYPTHDFRNLVSKKGTCVPCTYLIEERNVSYSNKLMVDLKKWLEDSGNNIIYIYGQNDPYTHYAVKGGQNTNSVAFFLNGKNHTKLEYFHMNEQEKSCFTERITEWLSE